TEYLTGVSICSNGGRIELIRGTGVSGTEKYQGKRLDRKSERVMKPLRFLTLGDFFSIIDWLTPS
ncbi:MAG: hypothetical protein PUE50_06680, partial [Firmicutes bacterium]|nr:hypothetical protein [Bacillota bacterium]